MAFFLKQLNHKEKIQDPKPSCFFNRMHHGDRYFALNKLQFILLQELSDLEKMPNLWDTKRGFTVLDFLGIIVHNNFNLNIILYYFFI